MGDHHRSDADHHEHSQFEPTITICRTDTEIVVFLEVGNQDGWIATDFTVEPDR